MGVQRKREVVNMTMIWIIWLAFALELQVPLWLWVITIGVEGVALIVKLLELMLKRREK